jgi:hypothetical protein
MVRFLLQMSDARFFGKDLIWTADPQKTPLYQFEHYDIALNKLVELNTKDINLRAKVTACEIDGKGNIILPDSSSNAA